MDYPIFCLLIVLCLGYIQCYGQNYYYENHKYCDDLSPYFGEIDLDTISGVWYGVEKIPHASKGEYRIEHTNECFHIEIKETDVQAKMFTYLVPLLGSLSKVYYGTNVNYCPNLHPTTDFDEEAILGMWYLHEFIFHKDSVTTIEYSLDCPVVYLWKFEYYVSGGLLNWNVPTPPTPYPPLTNYPYVDRTYGLPEQYRIRHFVLEWHEGLWQADYHIRVNTSHKGFWPTDVPDRSVDKNYRFFGGVIQVLKVAHNHLVLNFCMRLPNSQLYSVVLSRNENQLTQEDLSSIHRIFSMKNLSTSALKRVCESSTASVNISSVMLIVTCVLFWRSR